MKITAAIAAFVGLATATDFYFQADGSYYLGPNLYGNYNGGTEFRWGNRQGNFLTNWCNNQEYKIPNDSNPTWTWICSRWDCDDGYGGTTECQTAWTLRGNGQEYWSGGKIQTDPLGGVRIKHENCSSGKCDMSYWH